MKSPMKPPLRQKRRLGRGLSALIGDLSETQSPIPQAPPPAPQASQASQARQISPTLQSPRQEVLLASLRPGSFQPRRRFDEEEIRELAASIKAHGLIQPLLVRPVGDGNYEIIAGERRFRAAQLARIHKLPVLVRRLSDDDSLQIGLIENIQRADLSPLEEARGFDRLLREFGHTQAELAAALGKSRPYVANMLRLLGLPDEIQRNLEDGLLSAGHARALLSARDPQSLARRVLSEGLNVRETERYAQSGIKARRRTLSKESDADSDAFARQITQSLGLRVSLHSRAKGGEVRIVYRTLDQLEDLKKRLCAGPVRK